MMRHAQAGHTGTHTHTRATRSVVGDLAATAALTLFVVGGITFALCYVAFSMVLETRLEENADRLARQLSESLHTHIWNMDGDSIREYMAKYPESSGLTRLSITSEFGDLIYETPGHPTPNGLDYRRKVFRNGQCIGLIDLSMSRAQVRVVQKAITYSATLIMGLGSLVVLVVMVLRYRIVLGHGFYHLLKGLQVIANGDYAHRLSRATHLEFTELNDQINRMAEQIESRTARLQDQIHQRETAEAQLLELTNSLEQQVESRTRELQETNRMLQKEIAERRKAESEILAISGREQQQLGRDLHDSLGQQLVGISYLSQSMASRIAARAPEEARQAVEISRLLNESVAQARKMAHGLHPVGMPGGGIREALEEQARHIGQLFDMTCDIQCEDFPELGNDTATHLYRITQEALTNARRHGRATHTWISLVREDHSLHLCITDNGCGSSSMLVAGEGIGMQIMRYRAEAIGGQLEIEDRSGGGISISVTAPLPKATGKTTD